MKYGTSVAAAETDKRADMYRHTDRQAEGHCHRVKPQLLRWGLNKKTFNGVAHAVTASEVEH